MSPMLPLQPCLVPDDDGHDLAKSSFQSADIQTQLGNVNPVGRVPSGPISRAATATTFPRSDSLETSCRSWSLERDATVLADYASTTTTAVTTPHSPNDLAGSTARPSTAPPSLKCRRRRRRRRAVRVTTDLRRCNGAERWARPAG